MHFSPAAMHIPDGFLSVLVAVIFWFFSIAAIVIALIQVNKDLGEREVPLMGVVAAAIFAGQMLNFSVTGGTSGHLLGAALATILLGPWAAILVMTSVVTVQALVFQDGGLLALGANLFNMGVVGVAVSYAIFHTFQKISAGKSWGVFAGSTVAAWCSIFIASLSCALQLALSQTSPANIAVPAMAGIHALIGVGEALITLGAVTFLYTVRRDLLKLSESKAKGNLGVILGGFAIALLLAVISPIASSHPDGLEWVAEKQGFLANAQGPLYQIIPDYVLPGLQNEALATIFAGILGVLLVAGVAIGVAYARRKRETQPNQS